MASKAGASVSGGVKRKHQSISIQDKVEVLKKLDRVVSVRKLCDTYGIGKSTVYDIKEQREKLLTFYKDSDSKKQMSIRKTMKDGKSTEHDRVMMEWFRQRRSDGVDLSGTMLMEQAKLFHTELKLEYQCDYSEGWLQRFKKRHGISMQKVCGEKRSANHEGAAEYVDEFAKLVVYHCTDSEIIDMVVNPDKNNESDDEDSDEDEADVAERLSIDKLIGMLGEVIKGLERRSFMTKQEIMNLYLMHEKLHRERSKHMKQLRLDEMFNKIAKKNVCQSTKPTSENPEPSTSSTPDVPPATSQIHEEMVIYDTDSNPDSPQLPDLCD